MVPDAAPVHDKSAAVLDAAVTVRLLAADVGSTTLIANTSTFLSFGSVMLAIVFAPLAANE